MDNDAAIQSPTPSGRGLRILIEHSEYWLRNNGDLAMMAVTLGRLRERWPLARIAVLTDSPPLLRAYFPQVDAIRVVDGEPWARPGPIERLAGHVGPRVVGPIAMSWLRTRTLIPQKARGARRRLVRRWRALVGDPRPVSPPPPPAPVTRGSFAALDSASLLLALGGGYLTDADAAQTKRVLNLVEQAHRRGVPVVMVGQGIGPIDDPTLRGRAAKVLPDVELVALRERRRGPALLDALGVPPTSVIVTGDDAIELAHEQRSDRIGSNIGFCLRIAGYSPVEPNMSCAVGKVVREAALEFDSTISPLMIAEYKSQDRRSTLPLVRRHPRVALPPHRYVRPHEIAARVADCRVMVTGAYHLAVFALSQGIPAVALTSSEYYDDKFLGLADMFENGLQMVDLRVDDAPDLLATAIRDAWEFAPTVREPLRARARAQIEWSRAGFDRAFALVERTQSAPT